MYYLISIILREPDILYEADPLPDLLALWKNHGVPNAMILETVDMQDLGSYYASAMGLMGRKMSNAEQSDDSFLFTMPESESVESTVAEAENSPNSHRMVLTIMQDSADKIEQLLDQSSHLIQEKLADAGELIFVFPLTHVRGFAASA